MPLFWPTAVEAGLHPPGLLQRHVDRVLPVYELIVVGGGVLPIAEDTRRFLVGAGDWLLLYPHRRHWGTADLGDDLWFYWLCFSLDDAQPATVQTGSVNRPDRMRSLFRDLLADQEAGTLSGPSAAAFAVLLLNELRAGERSRAILAERAADFVAAHLSEPGLTTARVASALYCNPDHLGRVFRVAYGETLVEHIHAQRVARARTLFRSTEWSLERIATETGFRDPRYFTRVFKRLVGLSPRQFRLLHPRPS